MLLNLEAKIYPKDRKYLMHQIEEHAINDLKR